MKKLPLLLIAMLLLVLPFPAAGSSRLAAPLNSQTSYVVQILTDTVGECPGGAVQCTLRTAIEKANSDGTGSLITFIPSLAGGTIELTSSLPAVTDSLILVITGPTGGITISGKDMYQILAVSSGASLTLNNLTFAHGNTIPFNTHGGAINNAGSLTINQCDFHDNQAPQGRGGAIYNTSPGELVVNSSTFENNQALWNGGAIHNLSSVGDGITTLEVNQSTFQNNHALSDGSGGAISTNGGQYTLTYVSQSLLKDNTAGSSGGAIYHGNGETTIINSTLSGNSAARGGGIINATGWTTNLINDTFVNNTAIELSGWNIQNLSRVIKTRNTIVMGIGNPERNCGGDISYIKNDGNNIDNGSSCGFGHVNGSLSNTNPLLQDLADNGGPTLTMGLQIGSPAIDGVTVPPALVSVDCPTMDQRGVTRPLLGKPIGTALCDIGAYEFEPPTWLFVFLPLVVR